MALDPEPIRSLCALRGKTLIGPAGLRYPLTVQSTMTGFTLVPPPLPYRQQGLLGMDVVAAVELLCPLQNCIPWQQTLLQVRPSLSPALSSVS